MTWTRIGDDFTDRPQVLRLSRSARMLHVEALVWCNRLLTDGAIPVAALHRISDSDNLAGDTDELAGEGLWTQVDDQTWQIDWSDQEPAKKVEQRREDNAARQRAYNDRRRRDASRNASGDGSSNTSDNGLPTRPDPTPREGRRRGAGDSTSDDSASLRACSPTPPSGDSDSVPDLGIPDGFVVEFNGKKVGL